MKLPALLVVIPERAWLLVCVGIIFLALAGSYAVRTESQGVERKIEAKQRELASVIQLKELYETRKRGSEKSAGTTEGVGMSLASLENIVSKSFVAGRLTALKPATAKEEKQTQHMPIDVSVTAAPLGEIVSFLNAATEAGFHVTKLQLSTAQPNAAVIDMRVVLVKA